MRYHPISLNVIRGSLKLMGLPQPIHIRMIDQSWQPSGELWTMYDLCYRYQTLRSVAYRFGTPYPCWEGAAMNAFEACFCSDISVLNVGGYNNHHEFFVRIVTRMDPMREV